MNPFLNNNLFLKNKELKSSLPITTKKLGLKEQGIPKSVQKPESLHELNFKNIGKTLPKKRLEMSSSYTVSELKE